MTAKPDVSKPRLRESLRKLPRPAWILFVGAGINRFGGFVVVFLMLYLSARGYSPAEAGIVASGYGLGSLAAAGYGGFLADRLGRKNTIAISMFSAATTVLLLSQARSLPAIAALVFLTGFAGEMYRPASAALLTDLVPADNRVVAFGAYRLAVNAGFAFGPAVAGFLADRNFLYIFIGDAVTSIVYGVIALVWLPEGVRTRRHEEEPGEGWATALRDRHLVRFCFAAALGAIVYMQIEVGVPLHVRDAGLSSATFGTLVALNGILIVFLELPVTTLTARLDPRRAMAAGSFLTGVGFALTGSAHAFWTLALTVTVWTLGEMIHAPVSNAYVSRLAPERLRGRYQGALSFSIGLGFVIGPAAGGVLYGWNATVFWLACLASAAAAAVIYLGLPENELVVEPAVAIAPQIIHPVPDVGHPPTVTPDDDVAKG